MSTDQRLLHARSASRSKRRRPAGRLRRLGRLALCLAAMTALDGVRPARAQALNDEIVRLLDMNCQGLADSRTGFLDPNQLGPRLGAICAFPPTFNGASAGGGSASVQSSTTSIQNSVLQRRLARAKRPTAAGGPVTSPWLSRDAIGDASLLLAGPEAESTSGDASDPALGSRRFDLFASGAFESLDRDESRFEDGFDSSVKGATIGADYRFTDKFVVGLLATYGRQEGDFDGGGDFEVTSFVPTLYASILPTEKTFIHVVLGRSAQDFDVERDVRFTVMDPNTRVLSGTTTSETDGLIYSAGAQFGYDHSVRQVTFGPRVGVNYSRTTIDAFVETGTSGLELRLDDQTVTSFQGVAGFYGSLALSVGSGVVLPQATVEYVHEFEDSPDLLDAQFAEDLRGTNAATFHYETNAPDSDFFNLEVGVAAVFPRGIQPYINLRAMLGNTHFDNLAGTIGVRFEL